jgi:hydrogenase nickel incorporation protein HypA/HybF
MHELGLVNYVVKEVSKVAEENNVSKIKSVTLEFGEVSGIVVSYLYDYWDWYTKKFPVFEGAELKCEEIPAVTWCDDCKITYSTIAYGKTCPRCGSGNTWLLRGNEMMIKEVEVEDVDAEADADSGAKPSDGTGGKLEASGEYRPQ